MSSLNFAIETKNCDIIWLLLNHPKIDVNIKKYKYLSFYKNMEYDEVCTARNSVFKDYQGIDNEMIYYIDRISVSVLGQCISALSDNKDILQNEINKRNKIIEFLSNHPNVDINFGKKHDSSLLYIYYYQDWIDNHSSCIYNKVINSSQTPLFMSINEKSTMFYEILMKNTNIKIDILSNIDNCNELNNKRKEIYSQFRYKVYVNEEFNSIVGGDINRYKPMTCLELAVLKNDIYITKCLLKIGNSYDIDSKISVNSLLRIAIEFNCLDVFKLLLNIPRIDLNLQSSDGKTLLYLAIEKDQMEMIKLLLERTDINVNLKTNENITALSIAAEKENIEVVQLLLKRPDIEIDLNNINRNISNNEMRILELIILNKYQIK